MTSSLLKKNSAKTVAKADANEVDTVQLSGNKQTVQLIEKLVAKYGAENNYTLDGSLIACGKDAYLLHLKRLDKSSSQGK